MDPALGRVTVKLIVAICLTIAFTAHQRMERIDESLQDGEEKKFGHLDKKEAKRSIARSKFLRNIMFLISATIFLLILP